MKDADRTYVGIPTPTLVYVGVADRAEFDTLDRPMTDCGRKETEDGRITHVLAKTVEQDRVLVIFQYFVEDNFEEWLHKKVDRAVSAGAA